VPLGGLFVRQFVLCCFCATLSVSCLMNKIIITRLISTGFAFGSVIARHSGSARASAKLCGVEQRAPPIFGRAAITLGIGPHSSSIMY